jgi:hypothetical protein
MLRINGVLLLSQGTTGVDSGNGALIHRAIHSAGLPHQPMTHQVVGIRQNMDGAKGYPSAPSECKTIAREEWIC